jgi:hypothetical protein
LLVEELDAVVLAKRHVVEREPAEAIAGPALATHEGVVEVDVGADELVACVEPAVDERALVEEVGVDVHREARARDAVLVRHQHVGRDEEAAAARVGLGGPDVRDGARGFPLDAVGGEIVGVDPVEVAHDDAALAAAGVRGLEEGVVTDDVRTRGGDENEREEDGALHRDRGL